MEPIETERLIIRRMRDDDLRHFLEYESDSEHTRYLSRRAYTGDQARDFIATERFYSMTRRAGDTLYLSGFGSVDDDLNVVGADIGEQTRFTMDAIRRTL